MKKMIKKIYNSKILWKILYEILSINYKNLILDIFKIVFLSNIIVSYYILSLVSMDELQNQDLINTFRATVKQMYWLIYFIYILLFAIRFFGGRSYKTYKFYHPEPIFDKNEWEKRKKKKEKYLIIDFVLCLNKEKISNNIIAVIVISFMYSFIKVLLYEQEISGHMVDKEFFISCPVCFIIMILYEMLYYVVGNRIIVEEKRIQ